MHLLKLLLCQWHYVPSLLQYDDPNATIATILAEARQLVSHTAHFNDCHSEFHSAMMQSLTLESLLSSLPLILGHFNQLSPCETEVRSGRTCEWFHSSTVSYHLPIKFQFTHSYCYGNNGHC